MRELALCDELGFDFGFAVEHHFSPQESWMPSPAVYCTGGAARTRRLRLGPMGYIPSLYNPLRIVEEAAVLDQVLHGRLELGLVSGILPDYFVPYKADFHSRRQVTYEAVLLLNVEYLLERNLVFVGSPETVTRQVEKAAAEGLFNTLLCEFNLGSVAEEDLMHSMYLFGTRVTPALRAFEPY